MDAIRKNGNDARGSVHSPTLEDAIDRLIDALMTGDRARSTALVPAERARGVIGAWLREEARGREQLFAQACHDLKSPLSSIVFLADALYSGGCGELDAAQRAQVRVIYAAALSALNRVQNTLDSHELQIGVRQPVRVPLSLRAALEELERVALPLAETHSLDLRLELACASMREGDPDILNRILLNLVTRALSLTVAGGVVVRVGNLDEDLLVTVAAGPGLDETDLETPLSDSGVRPIRAGTTTDGDPFGSALAVSICQRLARSVGGEISVACEPPGSRFRVRLPFPPVRVECGPTGALGGRRAARDAGAFTRGSNGKGGPL